MAAKYYAVRKGRSTGVFMTWSECQNQVKGFPGAVFKSFPSIAEAEAFIKGVTEEETRKGTEIFDLEPDVMVAYVDGSYHSGTGEFSYGMVLLVQGEEIYQYEKYQDPELASMRNVAGEIKGSEAAMKYAVEHGYHKLYIYHDYEGISKWCEGLWKTNKEGTKSYKMYYDSIKENLQVVFVKVAAHTGDHYNEMADQLAKKALSIV